MNTSLEDGKKHYPEKEPVPTVPISPPEIAPIPESEPDPKHEPEIGPLHVPEKSEPGGPEIFPSEDTFCSVYNAH